VLHLSGLSAYQESPRAQNRRDSAVCASWLDPRTDKPGFHRRHPVVRECDDRF